jgi:hypothetical protein
LEGGYDLRALAGSVAATLEVFGAGDANTTSVEPDPLTQKAQSQFSKWWPVAA